MNRRGNDRGAGRAPDERRGGGVSTDRLIELRLEGRSYRNIAREVGLATSTVAERLSREEPKAKIAAALEGARERAAEILSASAEEAAQALGHMADGTAKPNAARVQAATAILERVGLSRGVRVEVSGQLATGAAALTDQDLAAELAGLVPTMVGERS